MKRFICLFALSLGGALGLLDASSVLGQTTPSYDIVIGQPSISSDFQLGGMGTLPVFLRVSNPPSTTQRLTGFSLAFDFTVNSTPTSSAGSYFMSPLPGVTSSFTPAVSIQPGGTSSTNYDVLVNWATAATSEAIDLVAGVDTKLFDLAFNIAANTPLSSMDPSSIYNLGYIPVATQIGSAGQVTLINELSFADVAAVRLTGLNSASIGGNFSVSAVPEPASVALCGVGAAALVAGAWRRKRRQVTEDVSVAGQLSESSVDEVVTAV